MRSFHFHLATGSTRDSTSPIDTVWREAAASPKVAISARAWRQVFRSDCLGLLVYSKICQSLGAHKVQELVQPVIVVSDVALMNGIFNDVSG